MLQKRLEEIGLEYTEYPEDAYGEIRCAPEQELLFQVYMLSYLS